MNIKKFFDIKNEVEYEDEIVEGEEIKINARRVKCPRCGNTFDVFPFLSSCTCEKCKQEIILDGMPPLYG